MRLWLLGLLVVVCIVAGLLIPVPKIEYKEAFLPTEPTAAPMANIGLADREVDISTKPTLIDEKAQEVVDPPNALQEGQLVFSEGLKQGIVDMTYDATDPTKALVLDIAARQWNHALLDAPATIDLASFASKIDETILSCLPIQEDVLVLGGDQELFLHLYSAHGKLLTEFSAPSLALDQTIQPMTNKDCAFLPLLDGVLLIDLSTGEITSFALQDRLVFFNREANTLLLGRGDAYVVYDLATQEETIYTPTY